MLKNRNMYRRAKKVFSDLQKTILPKHKGKIIAIEPTSRDYIIGTDEVQVALEGRKKYPGKKIGLFKIGTPVVHKLR